MSTYRFILEQSEAALNIVLGSALGAYLGVALSLAPDKIEPVILAGFLAMIYFFVRTLLLVQHYARERYWVPFASSAAFAAIFLYVSFRLSDSLPLDSYVFLSVGALWLLLPVTEPLQNLIFERFVPKKDPND